MLVRMTHRGACGCEENTGDGAGILVAVPDGFLRKAAREAGIGELPAEGEYAVGNIFVPKFENAVPEAKAIVERVCKQRGMKVRSVAVLRQAQQRRRRRCCCVDVGGIGFVVGARLTPS